MKKQRWEESGKRQEEERRSETIREEKGRRRKINRGGKVEESETPCAFQCFEAH
jgi:hypothetical protein